MHKQRVYMQELGSLAAFAVIVLILGVLSPEFRTVSNFLSLIRQSAVNGLIAFGMTVVILTGGIDLSVGSVLALCTSVCAMMISSGVNVGLAMTASLALGVILGGIGAVMIAYGKIQPFIATLVTMTIYRGITMIITGGKPVSKLGESALLNGIGRGVFLGIPVPVWILAVIFFIFLFILKKMIIGRKIYAVGSNDKAAALAGVNINGVKILVYSISGLMSALAGLILLSRLGSAQPTLGSGYELDAIAAVAVGGTSMSGGRGQIYGTLIGVLIIAVLNNGLNIMGVSSYYQEVVRGIVILLAVLSDRKR